MDLVGTGRRLTSADLLAAANKVGVDVATIRAVIEVETAGAGFDAKKRLKLLFEPHVFYKQLGPGPKRDQAVKQGLAYAKAGARPYPPLSKRYDQIAAAIAIDENAALNSASWGLPRLWGSTTKPPVSTAQRRWLLLCWRAKTSSSSRSRTCFLIGNWRRRSKTGIGAPFHSDTTAQMLLKMTMMGNSKPPLKGSPVLPHVP